MPEILIVDDESSFLRGLEALFVGEGFSVRTACDGETALRVFAERRPDLVLLDVSMPVVNGFRACGEIRKADRLVPIVFLTARDSDADQVRGLGLGADDYVSKSSDEAVLVARVRRALERVSAFARAGEAKHTLHLGAATVDLGLNSISVDGREEHLTKTEGDILRILAGNGGRPLTTDELIDALRGDGFACEDSLLYVHVSNLRRKLGSAANFLVSGRSSGYRLVR